MPSRQHWRAHVGECTGGWAKPREVSICPHGCEPGARGRSRAPHAQWRPKGWGANCRATARLTSRNRRGGLGARSAPDWRRQSGGRRLGPLERRAAAAGRGRRCRCPGRCAAPRRGRPPRCRFRAASPPASLLALPGRQPVDERSEPPQPPGSCLVGRLPSSRRRSSVSSGRRLNHLSAPRMGPLPPGMALRAPRRERPAAAVPTRIPPGGALIDGWAPPRGCCAAG